tara:strand:- start:2887 stop:3654 length:768 start_codon:yes stop_codon:yes gene_type:complete
VSSIYRKGRDGYYYYQTYVYNIESKKKDKKIFHSLSTKNLEVAKEKQKGYDEKYRNQNNIIKKKKRYFLKNKTRFFLFLVFCLITFFVFVYSSRKDTSSQLVQLKDIKVDTKKVDKVPDAPKLEKIKNNVTATAESQQKVNKTSVSIPEYKIQRIDELSSGFKQGKIFLTVYKPYDKDGLLLLCQALKTKYSKYENIIICLYNNTQVGINLSLGLENHISSREESLAWLAMFSYNSVEGEYFDNNPGGYLSSYKK